jgi:hypothetical protein
MSAQWSILVSVAIALILETVLTSSHQSVKLSDGAKASACADGEVAQIKKEGPSMIGIAGASLISRGSDRIPTKAILSDPSYSIWKWVGVRGGTVKVSLPDFRPGI